MMQGAVTRALLLGSGASSPTPSVRCLASGNPCGVCLDACSNPHSKNRRTNPSLLLEYKDGSSVNGNKAVTSSLMVDMGKTFREQYFKFLTSKTALTKIKYNNRAIHPGTSPKQMWSPYVDSILLTHFHADAMLGLDDVRELLAKGRAGMPLFCDAVTLKYLRTSFPYLVPEINAEGRKESKRWIGTLSPTVIKPYEPFKVSRATTATEATSKSGVGLEVIPIPLDHGDCTSFGFIFPLVPNQMSGKPRNLVYLSDVGKISQTEIEKIKSYGPIEVLFIDCLVPEEKDFVNHAHLGGRRTVEAALALGAKKTMTVGMNHACDYEALGRQLNAFASELGSDGAWIDVGFDGAEFAF